MTYTFGNGKIGIILSGSSMDGPTDLIILDPEKGTGKVGQRTELKEETETNFSPNALYLQFKNPESVDVLIHQLEKVKASLRVHAAKGVKPEDFQSTTGITTKQ